MSLMNGLRLAAAGGVLAALAVFLAPVSAEADHEKKIPVRIIPRKNIPNKVTYGQAAAFTKRQRQNRKLVKKARGENRRLRRWGTAYDEEGR